MHTSSPSYPIVVVFCADNNYSLPLSVALYSAMTSTSAPLSIFVLENGISLINKKRIANVVVKAQKSIKKTVELNWITYDLSQFNLPTRNHLTQASYLRLFIPEILPEQYKKCIYLDCDILVEGDLRDLWEESVDDFCFGAVTNWISKPNRSPWLDFFHLTYDNYFNSGVLLFNLENFRKEQLSSRALSFCKEHPELLFNADQDALNAVSRGKWKKLSPKWNQQVKYMMNLPPINEGILHFVTSKKPWLRRARANSSIYYKQYYSRYNHLVLKTGFLSLPKRIFFTLNRLTNNRLGKLLNFQSLFSKRQ